MPQRTFTNDRGIELRIPSGSTHHGTTPSGSRFTICTKRDEFGRGSSHAIWGITPQGRYITLVRNVKATDVIPLIRLHEQQGYKRIAAGIEAF